MTRISWEQVLAVVTGAAAIAAAAMHSLSFRTTLAALTAIVTLIVLDRWRYRFEKVEDLDLDDTRKQEARRTAVEFRQLRSVFTWSGPGLLLAAVAASFLWSQLPAWASIQASRTYGQTTSTGSQSVVLDFEMARGTRFIKEPPDQPTMVVGRTEPKLEPGRRLQFVRLEEVVEAIAGRPDDVMGGFIGVVLVFSVVSLCGFVAIDRIVMARFLEQR